MDRIKKEDILSALNEIKANPELRKGRASSTYDIIYEGIEYPPKLVISIANKHATGIELGPNDFKGGIGTPSFKLIKECGFEIKQKEWLITPIIEDFLEQSKTNDLKTKDYQKKFKGFSLKISFGQGVPAKIPWIGLTKEPHTISNGIYPVFLFYKEFNTLILAYGVSETTKSTFKWPETDKLVTIKDWCNNKYGKTPDRYGDSYIKGVYELIEEFDSELLENDLTEIIKVYNNIEDGNVAKQGYWIFQGSPKIYNMAGALEANVLKTWTVSSHKDKIKNGDKFILWLTGEHSGCYALGSVISDVKYIKEEDEEMYFYIKPTKKIENFRVNIKIDHNFFDTPVQSVIIKNNPVFKNFKGGNQGTNFISTKEEFESILNLSSQKQKSYTMKNNIELNQILYGPPGTGKTFKLQNKAIIMFQLIPLY
jgi:5-methylcytosine-specific restriction protein B